MTAREFEMRQLAHRANLRHELERIRDREQRILTELAELDEILASPGRRPARASA